VTWSVQAPCAAGVSEVVPAVAPASIWAAMTPAPAVGFTSLLTSFPQLKASRRARSGRMNNLTPPVPLHSPTHPHRGRGHAAIGSGDGAGPTCRDDRRRDRRRTETPTSDDSTGVGRSAHAYFLSGMHVATVGTRDQSTSPLDPVSATAVANEPDQQPIAIQSSDGASNLQDCVRCIVDNAPPLTEARRGQLTTPLRLHAADRVERESRCDGWHFDLRWQPTTAIRAARTEEQHR
jgi:hypothetical protein